MNNIKKTLNILFWSGIVFIVYIGTVGSTSATYFWGVISVTCLSLLLLVWVNITIYKQENNNKD